MASAPQPTNGASLLLSSITAYFSKHKHYQDTFYEISEGLSPVSLRLIDWFVTHYAKSQHILYWINNRTNQIFDNPPESEVAHMRRFNLYLEYRAQLKSYTKLHFDPFRRHERITFVLDRGTHKTIETTVGQLNFFRWALSNHVISYIMSHHAQIEAAMAAFQKKNKTGSTPAVAAAPLNTVIKAPRHIRFD
jgi:hypothetical protein